MRRWAAVVVLGASAACSACDPEPRRYRDCPESAAPDTVCVTTFVRLTQDWTDVERSAIGAGVRAWRAYGYDVRVSDAEGIPVVKGHDPGALGEVKRDPLRIELRGDLSPRQLRIVATHEVGHVLRGSDGIHMDPSEGAGIMNRLPADDRITDDDVDWMCERTGFCPLP